MQNRQSYRIIMLSSVLRFLLTGAIIFISAGRINYWQGWVFIVIHLCMFAVTIPLFSGKSDLLQERVSPGGPAKKWDYILVGILFVCLFAILIVSALDSGRYRWSPTLPVYTVVIAWIFYLAGVVFSVWAMYVNRFFSSIVRIQSDRGHFVITEGPYRYVRHPGYSGMLLLCLAIPICMSSLYALIPGSFAIITLIIRTSLEDRTLTNELDGYRDYVQKTKFRLIPFIW